MRYGIVFLSVLLSAALTLQAETLPTDQSIAEMMNIMQLEALLGNTLKQMTDGMKAAMEQALRKSSEGKELTAAQKAKVDEFRKKFDATMSQELNMAKVKAIYTQAYKSTFSQEEVNSIVAFYRSPAGKAILQKNPDAMRKANESMQTTITPLGHEREIDLYTGRW